MKRQLSGLGLLVGILATVAGVCAPRRAAAQEANGFGDKQQLILSVDRLVPLLSYDSQTLTNNQGVKTTDSSTSVAVLLGRAPNIAFDVHTLPRVAFDFTVIKHLTLGGSFAFAVGLSGTHEQNSNGLTRTNNAPKTTVVGIAPRVGYVIPLGHLFAFWPRAGFAYYSVSTKTEAIVQGGNAIVTTTDSDTALSLDLDPQFVWTPIEHFFINFGPLLNIPVSGSREETTGNATFKNDLSTLHVGISAGLGGWFDL